VRHCSKYVNWWAIFCSIYNLAYHFCSIFCLVRHCHSI